MKLIYAVLLPVLLFVPVMGYAQNQDILNKAKKEGEVIAV
jgi:hypothetical protein